MRVSVIIPALNEAENIVAAIQSVKRHSGEVEIIVVDGGSMDDTIELARPYARVIASERGRAIQMNAGARQADSDLLLFLHADSRLHPQALMKLREVLNDPCIVGGTFTLIFDADNFWLRFYAWCSTIDWLCFRYGDQGVFVRRSIFEQMGGYAEIPLMEDIDLMQRMPTYGRRVLIRNHPVTTSARRFFEHGVIRQEALNVLLVALWFSGVKPHRLAKWYAARRVTTLRISA